MNIQEYIASGILELFVLGHLPDDEAQEVQRLAAIHREIEEEIDAITTALIGEAESFTDAPHPAVKPFLAAMIDYSERLKNGEAPAFPPELNERSTISDYRQWLDRSDLEAPVDFEHVHARIIGHTPQMQTALLWLRYMAPQEVHHHEYEKFLILEGSCDIIVGNKTHSLLPGDYFCIPLHERHEVRITSAMPCKAILQRVAA